MVTDIRAPLIAVGTIMEIQRVKGSDSVAGKREVSTDTPSVILTTTHFNNHPLKRKLESEMYYLLLVLTVDLP